MDINCASKSNEQGRLGNFSSGAHNPVIYRPMPHSHHVDEKHRRRDCHYENLNKDTMAPNPVLSPMKECSGKDGSGTTTPKQNDRWPNGTGGFDHPYLAQQRLPISDMEKEGHCADIYVNGIINQSLE